MLLKICIEHNKCDSTYQMVPVGGNLDFELRDMQSLNFSKWSPKVNFENSHILEFLILTLLDAWRIWHKDKSFNVKMGLLICYLCLYFAHMHKLLETFLNINFPLIFYSIINEITIPQERNVLFHFFTKIEQKEDGNLLHSTQ